jgi:hypothetical protein
MKVKLKLDRSAIREFFLQHVEKIVFAGVVVCFVAIVYGATTREMFPVMPNTGGERATPDDLASLAGNAQVSWEETVPNPPDYETIDFRQKVGLDRILIKEVPYAIGIINRPIVEQRRKRGLPLLYEVKELRGTADRGRISMVQRAEDAATALRPGGAAPFRPYDPAGNVPQGQRWVVLTGLIPIEEQFQEYYEYFKTAQVRGPGDVPAYVGYIVQRAEVSSPDAGEPLRWSETFYSGKARRDAQLDWGSASRMTQDVVDPRFLDPEQRLNFPLPPSVDRGWDESVAHDPEIPLFRSDGEMYGLGEAETLEAAEHENPFDVFDPTRTFYGAPANVYNWSDSDYDGPMEGSYMPGQVHGRTSYYLFRFFDFNVEPGKRYRYRVRLVLRNPNLGVEDRYLSPEMLADKQQIEQEVKKLGAENKVSEARAAYRRWEMVESDWTDPSELISVPRDSRLLAVSVQPPTRVAGEPRGNVMVVSWVKDLGIEAFREESVQRGKVANFLNCRFPETKPPRRPSKRLLGEEEGYYQPAGSLQTADASSPVNYLTDTLVLDMHGGERLPGKDRLNRPGTILLMDLDGTLVVRHELDDLAECTELTESLAPEQPGGGYDDESEDDYESDFESLRGRRRPSRSRSSSGVDS